MITKLSSFIVYFYPFYLYLFSKQKTEEIVIQARTNLSFFF